MSRFPFCPATLNFGVSLLPDLGVDFVYCGGEYSVWSYLFLPMGLASSDFQISSARDTQRQASVHVHRVSLLYPVLSRTPP